MNNNNTTKLLKKFVGFSLASWISAGFGFLLTPIITRIIPPTQLGMIDIFVTYCNIFIYASTLGMHQSYMRFYRELPEGFTKERLLSFSVKVAAIGTLILTAFLLIFYKRLSNAVLGTTTISVALCMSMFILSVGFLDVMKTKPRMEGKVLSYTVIAVGMSALLRLSYIGYGFLRDVKGTLSLITAVMFCFALTVFIREQKSIRIPALHNPQSSNIAIFKYALPTVPALLISNLNASLPKLILNEYWDKSTVGIYAGALTLVSIIQLFQKGFTVFWAPYVFENYATKQKEIQKLHLLVIFGMTACGLGLILFQDVIYLILGTSYRSSKSIYAILMASPILYTIGETVGIGISIKKRTYLNIAISGFSMAIVLLVSLLLTPTCGNMGAAVSVLVSALCTLFLKAFLGEKYYQVICSKIKLIGGPALYMLAALGSLYFSDSWPIRSAIIMLALILLCVLFRSELRSIFAYVRGFFDRSQNSK